MVSIHHERGELAAAIMPVSALSETAAAIAVVVLSILGLIGVIPGILMGVTTIVVGCAILLMGAQTAAECAQLASVGSTAGAPGGITLDFLAGGVGVVLGILALFSHLAVLAPAALIVFGATLLLVGGSMARRRTLPMAATTVEQGLAEAVADQMSFVAGGAQLLTGVAAIVLGILAFIPAADHLVLTLVGTLTVGAGLLLAALGNGGFASLARW